MADQVESKRERDLRFEREALPWLDDVYRFARSMTHDEADADDLVQETYLRAYRAWDTFEPGSDCRRWLFTICRNVFLRTREREARQVDTGGDDAVLETMAAVREASPFATSNSCGGAASVSRSTCCGSWTSCAGRIRSPERTRRWPPNATRR